MNERRVECWLEGVDVVVRVGGRVERVHEVNYNQAASLCYCLGHQPAPVIWRALGVQE